MCAACDNCCRCKQCCLVLCEEHDISVHRFNACHDRESFSNGFYEAIPSNMAVEAQENGQYAWKHEGNIYF